MNSLWNHWKIVGAILKLWSYKLPQQRKIFNLFLYLVIILIAEHFVNLKKIIISNLTSILFSIGVMLIYPSSSKYSRKSMFVSGGLLELDIVFGNCKLIRNSHNYKCYFYLFIYLELTVPMLPFILVYNV